MTTPTPPLKIYHLPSGEVIFNLDPDQETLWATQAELAKLFSVDRTVISRHLRNIFKEEELEETSASAFFAHTATDGKTYQVKMYNLDAIISVGYRVNSKKATDFRKWATKVLHQYTTTGLAVNQHRLSQLDTQHLHQVEGMLGVVRRLVAHSELNASEANGVLEVISRYTTSFEALAEFDTGTIQFSHGRKARKSLTYPDCLKFIAELRESLNAGELFGKERDLTPTNLNFTTSINNFTTTASNVTAARDNFTTSTPAGNHTPSQPNPSHNTTFAGNLATIEQNFDGVPLYKTIAERAAHLLYFIIKDHPFYDGNKRIASLLFIIYLTINDYHLTKDGETKISDRAMVALALLIAESEPSEKDLIVGLICKLLD